MRSVSAQLAGIGADAVQNEGQGLLKLLHVRGLGVELDFKVIIAIEYVNVTGGHFKQQAGLARGDFDPCQ